MAPYLKQVFELLTTQAPGTDVHSWLSQSDEAAQEALAAEGFMVSASKLLVIERDTEALLVRQSTIDQEPWTLQASLEFLAEGQQHMALILTMSVIPNSVTVSQLSNMDYLAAIRVAGTLYPIGQLSSRTPTILASQLNAKIAESENRLPVGVTQHQYCAEELAYRLLEQITP